jgi:two-component system sensor histidine kinase BaeS
MSTPLRSRMTLITLTVLLLGIGLAAALSWLAVERLYLDTQRENLLAQARLTAAALEGQPLPANPEPYNQTLNILPGVHTRLLGEQGAVVLDLPDAANSSSLPVPLAENSASVPTRSLLQRPEIDSALQGLPATAVRRVASANNRRVLYAAAPIYAIDGKISGVVYLATPLPAGGLPLGIVLELLGALLSAALLATLAGRALAGRIARPLEEVAQAAQAVAAGDLDQHLPAGSDIRELHSLGDSFNQMTASLRQSVQARNAFIADVTHELRTPLTVIKGTIETLEDGALDDLEGRGPLLDSMRRESERLIRLVNELLVLTRADAGALRLELQSVDLAELARTRCEGLARLAGHRGVTLKVEAQEQTQAWADPDRVAQILDNLLDNAIRHAPEGSSVIVSIEKEGEEIRCAVSDSGPGIAAEHLPLIFERFYRADTSRTRQTGGTGLGLAIVQALVIAQNGHVAAESKQGQSTKITVWLPVG